MTDTDALLLDILRHAIRGKKRKITEALTEEGLRALLDKAEEQKILPLIFDAIYPSLLLRQADKTLVIEYQKQAVEWVKRQVIQTNEFLVMLHDIQGNGLDPIVMKGLVCRELYPQPMLRYSVDEDLLVSKDLFEIFHHALVDYGLQADLGEPDFDKEFEISYHHPSSPLYVELHRQMFAPDQEAFGLFADFFSSAHQHTITLHVQDMDVRTLSHTDHLLFLILHAFKHFLYGGMGIRQICDIGLYAQQYGGQVDWNHIVSSCQQAGMGILPAALFKILSEHLSTDLEKAHVPSEWQQGEVDILPLLDDIMTGGLMGNVDENRMHSSNITLGAVKSKNNRHQSFSGILRSLFPPPLYIQQQFLYVKRFPILLPIGWLHRIILYLTRVKKGKELHALETIKIGRERVALLRKYKVI
ncbi:MAG: nucleotidyltransferase family protein [Prevotella sp.]|nr:nucleotidyltransferase family protein [Prevotella sp.]